MSAARAEVHGGQEPAAQRLPGVGDVRVGVSHHARLEHQTGPDARVSILSSLYEQEKLTVNRCLEQRKTFS